MLILIRNLAILIKLEVSDLTISDGGAPHADSPGVVNNDLSKKQKRVVMLSPMPAEKLAYALARYSRSPDSIVQSVDWVRTHDSQKFLESFYFQYGHASIADLGHLAVCFEGISELAATEIEDEQLWDGQAKSTRYQDFSTAGFITPPEFDSGQASLYQKTGETLIATYLKVQAKVFEWLTTQLERPGDMKQDAYERNLNARAFDVARYLLFFGVPTNVGQVVSIRTLEKQVRRLKASEYGELRAIGDDVAEACADQPGCIWDPNAPSEASAPTLARHVRYEASNHFAQGSGAMGCPNLPEPVGLSVARVDLLRPLDTMTEIAATLLYSVTDRPYRELQQLIAAWSTARRMEVIEVRWVPYPVEKEENSILLSMNSPAACQ